MAFSSDETPRPLPYPLYNQSYPFETETPEGETASPFVWASEDNDERITITLELSLNEYVALATAIMVGCDIAYNRDAYKIWWIWLRSYNAVPICEQIINCIENDADVQAALAAFMAQQFGNGQGEQLPQRLMDETLNQNAETCDKNSLWGSCLYTVQILNRLNLDFLETMEALTDNQEMIAFFVGAIPVLETLPIDEAIEIADKIREFVNDVYLAGYDVDLEQEMACDLFCLAVANDCQLTTQLIFDYFKERALAIEGFEDVWQSALTIIHAMANWEEAVGEKVVLAMMACNVGFMTFLNSALGMDFGHFKMQAKSGIPDDDWETICEECPGPIEPEIGFDSVSGCSGPIGGTNLTSVGGGIWYAEGTLSTAGDVRVTIQRVGGGAFQINTFNSNVGIAASAWTPATGSCGLVFNGLPPMDTPLLDFVVTIQNTGSPLEISFNFFE